MVFSEDSRVKIPCVLHLVCLGYRYLSMKDAAWDEETNLFPEQFRSAIARINPDMAAGRSRGNTRYLLHSPTQIIRYSNRIEILNVGHSLKEPEQLGTPGSRLRNPSIAAVMHDGRGKRHRHSCHASPGR
jgi:hypothetical protein